MFPRASSFFGSAWPRRARSKAPLLVSSLAATAPRHAWAATAVRALRQARLWHAGPDAACATYSALDRAPLRLGDVASVHAALHRVAAFLAFVRSEKVDCAVLPGFLLGGGDGPSLSAPVLPWDSVLDATNVQRLAGGQTVFYSHARDVGAPADGLVWFDGGPARATHPPPPSPSLCHAHFGLAGSSCFVAGLGTALDAAVSAAVPSSHTPPTCVTDSRLTSLAEAAVQCLEGGLDRVGAWIAEATGGRPLFLTGPTWRAVARRLGRNASSLADLPPPPLPSLDDAILAAFAPDAPGVAATWAGLAPLVDAAVCQAAAVAGAPPPLDLALVLPSPPPSRLALLARTAAHIPAPVLDDDLTALTFWLRRPDRPDLRGGRTARLVWRDATTDGPRLSVSAHMDAIHLLALSTAAGADRAVLPAAPPAPDGQPRSWAQAVGVPAATAIYGAFPAALPPSIGLLLDPASSLDAPSPLIPLAGASNLASVALLDEPRHARAVAALLRAAAVGSGAHPARFLINATSHALTRAGNFLPRGRGGGGCHTPVTLAFDLTGLDPGLTHGVRVGETYAAWLSALGAGSGGGGEKGGRESAK